MLAKLPGLIRIPLALLLLAINIVLHVVLLFAFTLFKVILPIRAIRLACSRVLVVIAESWIGVNSRLFDVFTRIRWQIDGLQYPVDAYVIGSQVWLREDGPGQMMIEWRLHPVGGYRRPQGTDTYEVFSRTALALATGRQPPAPLDALWDGLEAFSAYDEEIEPAPLVAAAVDALGLAPDLSGLVDHGVIGDAWERSKWQISIVDALWAQLTAN